MQKLKTWLGQKKNKLMATSSVVFAFSALAMSAMASGTTPAFDLSSVMETAMTKIINDLLGMIATVFPITLTLLGAAIGISYGVRFIKKIAGKAG